MSSSEPYRPPSVPRAGTHAGAESRFAVVTKADPTALPRVLEHFALRDLMPHEVRVDKRGGASDIGELEIHVRVTGLDAQATGVVARKLGAMFCVTSAFGHIDEGEQGCAVS